MFLLIGEDCGTFCIYYLCTYVFLCHPLLALFSKSCPGYSSIVSFALPFYLVTSLLTHALLRQARHYITGILISSIMILSLCLALCVCVCFVIVSRKDFLSSKHFLLLSVSRITQPSLKCRMPKYHSAIEHETCNNMDHVTSLVRLRDFM